MNKCKFCENLESYKRLNGNREPDPELGRYKSEYGAALVIRNWYEKQGKKSAGRSTDYRYRGIGYKLNYCPECGRKL